jgi:hypothetical protein
LLLPLALQSAVCAAAAEACFYLFYYRRLYRKLNVIPQPCRPTDYTAADVEKMWKNFLHLTTAGGSIGAIDAWSYLRHWFFDARELSDIKRGNVEEMLVR